MKGKTKPNKQVPPTFVGKGTSQEGARFNIDIDELCQALEKQGREDSEMIFGT